MLSETRKRELLFPHEEVRNFQEELILDVEKTIKEKGRLVADAPTGLGKTAAVLGPALSYALEKNLTVWFLTNRQTQHRLAVETLKKIQESYKVDFKGVDLIGKKGMCAQEVKELFSSDFQEFCRSITEKGECEFLSRVKEKNKLTVEARSLVEEWGKEKIKHNEEIVGGCKGKGFCGYEIALELGKKAKVVIGDYFYVFNPFIQQNVFGKMGKELEEAILIVDEAHNLPSRVVEMLSYSLTDNMLRRAISEAKKFGYKEAGAKLESLNEVLREMNDFDKSAGEERLVEKEEFKKRVEKIKNFEELINELEVAGDEVRKGKKKSFMGGVASFLEAWQGEDEGFTRIAGEREGRYGKIVYLNYTCLDAGLVTKGILEKVHSAVLMSGTLKPTFMYKDILGVKGEEKSYPNPFPPENKLVMVVPETTTRYSLRGEEMYERIAGRCEEILKEIPGNCAVFFPSYSLRDEIGRRVESRKRKFWEKGEMDKEEKEKLLEEFVKEKDREGGVLLGVMGGSFGEGIDLPGVLKGVVVVGVPLGKPDLKTREVVRYFDRKFSKGWEYGYLYPAMNKCFQSAGRCIRSAEDKGAVVFLDERFSWPSYACCFPKENLIVTKEFGKFLGEFFGKNRKI